jgi:hypothetical protein
MFNCSSPSYTHLMPLMQSSSGHTCCINISSCLSWSCKGYHFDRCDEAPFQSSTTDRSVTTVLSLERTSEKSRQMQPEGYGIGDTPLRCCTGVVDNRLQNIVITLDKERRYLSQPGQPLEPPLQALSDEQAMAFLWTCPRSIMRRTLHCAAAPFAFGPVATCVSTFSCLSLYPLF